MNPPRLNSKAIPDLPEVISRPPLVSARQPGRIVHLGIGAFHRAHQALYTQRANPASDQQWHIVGASLRSSRVRDQLAPQDFLYQVVARDGQRQQSQLVNVVDGILVAPENPRALVAAIANPITAIVSLTVTEKGYCHLPDSGQLDLDHVDIKHDIAHPNDPRSAPGFIVAGLQQRFKNQSDGLTVLSCDNLPNNGQLCRTIVIALARQSCPELADWIATKVRFPSCMVDRIVPATSPAEQQQHAQRCGFEDLGMVVCEPFSQWVIEDCFAGPRPAWEKAGALLVEDVAPYETMKLRLLNGSHSSMAYLGLLARHRYMHEVINDPAIGPFIGRLMDREITPCLAIPADFDVEAYKAQLRERFANPALQHQTLQVAMDGTQKLPQRLLQTLRYQLQSGGEIDGLCIALAAWMAYVAGSPRIDDPLASEIRQRLASAGPEAGDIIAALMGMEAVFGSDLAQSNRLTTTLQHWLGLLQQQGVAATLSDYLNS